MIASCGYAISGRAQTRGTQSRSHSASSSGMSQSSRLSSVQRTFSNGKPASSHSARRYGVYEVEMMYAGQQRADRVQRLQRPGHEQDLLGAELLDVLVGDVEGAEERRDEAQRVAGVVAGLAGDVGEEVVVAC